MTDRRITDALSGPSESLQRLTQFARDMGQMTNLALIGERILSGLSDISRCPEGALFLVDREREQYRRLVARGAPPCLSFLSSFSFHDPLILHLTTDQQILDTRLGDYNGTHVPALASVCARLTELSLAVAIPLVNKGRLVAFVLLHSSGDPDPDMAGRQHMELVTAMAQSAANALDSMLVYEDLHQSQTLMRRTDRLRSLEIMAGGFAHEVRNPLTSIKTFVQLAPERKHDTGFIREFSRLAIEDIHRIERLLQDILDYARYLVHAARKRTSTNWFRPVCPSSPQCIQPWHSIED